MESITLIFTDGFSLRLSWVDFFERSFAVSVRFSLVVFSVLDSAQMKCVPKVGLMKHV